jgi:hypothetical protein
MEMFSACLVASTSHDELAAAQVISAWLSEASTFISPTGGDSDPVLADFLRGGGGPFPDYPGDEPVEAESP